MIDKLTISRIKTSARIEDIIGDFIELKKKGENYSGTCPFHDEKTPSFIVSPAKGIYKCFGCGAAGDSVKFVMEHKKVSYPEALKYIGDKYNIIIDEHIPASVRAEKTKEIERAEKARQKKEVAELATKQKTFNYLLETALKNEKTAAAEYLESRAIDIMNLPDDSFFQLNEYKEHPAGVVFFGSEKKCLNKRNFITPENGAKQFNYPAIKNALYNCTYRDDSDSVYITEGVINAMSIYQTGASAIAIFATTNLFSDVDKFKQYIENKNVIIAFDFDKNFAGQKAAIKQLYFIRKNFDVKNGSILIHPEDKDDNDLLQSNELAKYLSDQHNYIYPSITELKTYLHELEKDNKYKLELKKYNYYTRPAADQEEDGKLTKTTDALPDEVFNKLDISGCLSINALRDSKFKYVKEYTIIDNRKAHVHTSTFENPIFTIDDKIIIRPFARKPFAKITSYRKGKLNNWTYGLALIESEMLSNGDDAESVEDLKNKQKLKRVIITYNFIDFLNLISINENPVYLHAELDYEVKEQLLGFAYELYQCPANNRSDRKRAKKIASKNIEIKTYYLEQKFYSVSHLIDATSENYFKKHLNTALPLKFWEWDKKSKDFDLNVVILQNFLNGFGYYTHNSIRDKQGYMYIQIQGKVVSKMDKDIFSRQIKIFVDNYLSRRGENVKLRNKIMVTNRFSEQNLSNLKQIDLDFENSGPHFQNFFFDDGNMWTVTKLGIKLSSQDELKKYVWEEELLKYPSKVQKPPFEITYHKQYAEVLAKKRAAKTDKEKHKYTQKLGEFKHFDKYDITINDRNNYFLQYLFATSYVYFEKAELNGFFIKPTDFWYEFPKGTITEDEIKEIKLHLINKITWLGYYMKDHRQPADDYGLAILDAIDDLPGNSKRGAAGGGKSLITKGIKEVKRTLVIKAEREDFAEYAHRYEGYEDERVIVCDDMHLKSRIGNMLTDFSDGIYVNPKHKKVITIPFAKSPKVIITRNYIDDEGERVDRRLGRMFVFPFFHDNKSGRFKQRRKPSDWFGRMLYKDDTVQDKSNLINFFAYAYIANRHFGEVNPPMQDMEKFRLTKRIGEPLIEFLELYFDDKENFGYVDRVPFYKQFIEEQRFNMNNWQKTQVYNTSQKFKHLVSDYCRIRGWIFNPSELHTDDKRIRKQSETQQNKNGYYKITEHFFIHTTEGATEEIENEAKKINEPQVQKPEQLKIPVDDFPETNDDGLPF